MKNKLAITLALGLASTAHADEWVVDPAGQGDALLIQAAVELAADGDVIIVQPGTYTEGVHVQGKGLWIVAQQPGELVRVNRWPCARERPLRHPGGPSGSCL